jgi:hypothetical protein
MGLVRRAIVVAAALVAVSGSSAVAQGSLPKLATGWFPRYAVRPHTIYYTGDSTGTIGVLPTGAHAVGKTPGYLHWKTWTRVRAYAVGTLWIKSCLPDCAGSPFYRYPATVTATLPRSGRFSMVTLRYRYHGKPVVEVRCDSGHGYYDLPPDWPRSNNCFAKP